MSKGPDWTKTGTIVAMGEWLRGRSGALAVIVIRRDDGALAADPDLAAADVRTVLDGQIEQLVADLVAARKERRNAARAELGPARE